jgi:hypothetical protein
LGDGSTINRSIPVYVRKNDGYALANVTEIIAGTSHSCAIAQGVVPIAHVKGHSQILTERDDRTVFGQLSGHHHTIGTTNGDQHPIELVLQVGFSADLLAGFEDSVEAEATEVGLLDGEFDKAAGFQLGFHGRPTVAEEEGVESRFLGSGLDGRACTVGVVLVEPGDVVEVELVLVDDVGLVVKGQAAVLVAEGVGVDLQARRVRVLDEVAVDRLADVAGGVGDGVGALPRAEALSILGNL